MILLALFGCSADGQLSMANVQVLGSHNSYHVQTINFQPWTYGFEPLEQQVLVGIRQFEIDIWWDGGEWTVVHVPGLDIGTNCDTLSACVTSLEAGSAQLPEHLPILVLIEPKTDPQADADVALEAIEAAISQSFTTEQLLTPASIQGEAATLREAMAEGWPVLEGQRGRVIFVMHGRAWRDLVPNSSLLFVDSYGDLSDERAAIHSINDPFDPDLPAVVAAGHLVRTRADADVFEPVANDVSRRDQALASGAHFISTDFFEPHPITGYQVDLGGVGRCNPANPHRRCDPENLE